MNELQERLKNEIFSLCSMPTVSGFEKRASSALFERFFPHFDEWSVDAVGNHMLIKRCGRKDAPTVLIDTHFDEIGMMVSDICDGGFLKFSSIGGLSLSVLQGADVMIYGKKTLRGVIISTPPHLRSGEDDKLTDLDGLMIDTGYSRDVLSELAPVGTPVGFAPIYSSLLGTRIAGKSFDDKAPCAVCASAVIDTPREELCADVCLMLSCFEETSRIGGIAPALLSICPDYAMVVDVNLGEVPDVPKYETVPVGKGVSVSLSAATDRKLSLMTAELCKDRGIPYTIAAAPSSTGTNAPTVDLSGGGIAVVDIGLPLKNMHTYNELLDLCDCEALYRLVTEFIKNREIAELFGSRGKELPT